jgi:hypothetical protein
MVARLSTDRRQWYRLVQASWVVSHLVWQDQGNWVIGHNIFVAPNARHRPGRALRTVGWMPMLGGVLPRQK